jgi:hypothetical protein
MTMNATSSTNTASNGMMARFSAFLTFGELNRVEDSSSLDESSMIRAIAISAPPTPILTAEVMVIALDAADEASKLDSIRW